MDRETMQLIAKDFGLKADDSHIEDLFAYVQKIWPSLMRFGELDLKDLEPFIPHYSPKESS